MSTLCQSLVVDPVGGPKITTFCQRLYHRKCKRRGVGCQKKPKSCQRSLWTTLYLDSLVVGYLLGLIFSSTCCASSLVVRMAAIYLLTLSTILYQPAALCPRRKPFHANYFSSSTVTERSVPFGQSNLHCSNTYILLIRDIVVKCCNRRYGCETIHPAQKFTSMNLLQMPCIFDLPGYGGC